jgi:hypothetical protein
LLPLCVFCIISPLFFRWKHSSLFNTLFEHKQRAIKKKITSFILYTLFFSFKRLHSIFYYIIKCKINAYIYIQDGLISSIFSFNIDSKALDEIHKKAGFKSLLTSPFVWQNVVCLYYLQHRLTFFAAAFNRITALQWTILNYTLLEQNDKRKESTCSIGWR